MLAKYMRSAWMAGALAGFILGFVPVSWAGDQPAPAAPANADEAPAKRMPAPLDPATKEALITYTQGLAALNNGNTDKAIELLKKAIILKPLNPQFHMQLARAYQQAGKPQGRWLELRKTVGLDPKHAEALAEFQQMWQVAGAKGALDVGTTMDKIKAGLGDPDAQQSEGDRARWQYGFMMIDFLGGKLDSVSDLRGLEALKPAAEVLEFSLGGGEWQIKQRSYSRTENLLEYRTPDTAQVQQRIAVQRLAGLKKSFSAKQLMEKMEANLKQQFPDATWQVLRAGDDDLLYEWRLGGEGKPGEHEITRLMSGAEDIHRLSYSAKVAQLGDEERKRWIALLEQAKLVAEPLPAAPAQPPASNAPKQ
ncbi:MAG: hypothetical protein U1F68_05060 [Gammaproteobacteria bacterium]